MQVLIGDEAQVFDASIQFVQSLCDPLASNVNTTGHETAAP